MRSSASGLVLVLSAVFALAAQSARAEDMVAFESAAARSGARTEIRGYLTRPKGAGPFPAVVLLHSCLGLPSNRRAIAATIAGWGYVALFVDDFATRGLKETCAVDFNDALPDAYGALAFLGRLHDVDPTRIAAIGFSQGGDTALQIATGHALPASDDLRFKAVAAFYPPCANQADATLLLPTLILIGAADQVTPAADCERLARRSAAGAKLVVYPGAGHVFDDPQFAGGKEILGMRLEYNRKAAEQSKTALRDFLATELAR
ncbi:MAG TPA: dienelactone hydrolase family protein [Roseiarcus sp.]|nr:dienelactone hydrolase family protein [Roseiarcus sp.]